MLKKTYDWTMKLAASKNGLWLLALISFAESSFFPIPPDIWLIPMVLAAREKAFKIALVCTVASVIGGFFGYAIGYFFFDLVARPILEFYTYLEKFYVFQGYYNQWGSWIVFGAGLTPFPYKVITITSGFTNLDLVIFGIASIVSRGIRFFLLAWLLWKFGRPIKAFIERHLGLLTTLFFLLLLGGFLVIKLF